MVGSGSPDVRVADACGLSVPAEIRVAGVTGSSVSPEVIVAGT